MITTTDVTFRVALPEMTITCPHCDAEVTFKLDEWDATPRTQHHPGEPAGFEVYDIDGCDCVTEDDVMDALKEDAR